MVNRCLLFPEPVHPPPLPSHPTTSFHPTSPLLWWGGVSLPSQPMGTPLLPLIFMRGGAPECPMRSPGSDSACEAECVYIVCRAHAARCVRINAQRPTQPSAQGDTSLGPHDSPAPPRGPAGQSRRLNSPRDTFGPTHERRSQAAPRAWIIRPARREKPEELRGSGMSSGEG